MGHSYEVKPVSRPDPASRPLFELPADVVVAYTFRSLIYWLIVCSSSAFDDCLMSTQTKKRTSELGAAITPTSTEAVV